MWKLAFIKNTFSQQGMYDRKWFASVVIYNGTGEGITKEYKNFGEGISDLLKEGWEPFSVNDEVQFREVWFRMKVEE